MEVYFSSPSAVLTIFRRCKERKFAVQNYDLSLLESYVKKLKFVFSILLPVRLFLPCKDKILDSGAYELLTEKKSISEKYVWSLLDYYVDIIQEFKIQKFVEMDLDLFFPYQKIVEFRKYLERKTGKRPILVYHKTRSLDTFEGECKDYDYHGIPIAMTKYFPNENAIQVFFDIAGKYGTKLHGFGAFVNRKALFFPFYSVDGSLPAFLVHYKRFISINKQNFFSTVVFHRRKLSHSEVETKNLDFSLLAFRYLMEFSERFEKGLIPTV